LYASIAATLNFVVRAPRKFAEMLGKLLFWCGEDKIVYGSEAPIWQPQWALRAFWEFSIPQDLCEGYGYPQLTDQAKRKILGENLLRLHGMDPAETAARLGRPQQH
jgi:predicted TIM-barrel fold metal-dependent hydrolase